jgi:hypothetical protein
MRGKAPQQHVVLRDADAVERFIQNDECARLQLWATGSQTASAKRGRAYRIGYQELLK